MAAHAVRRLVVLAAAFAAPLSYAQTSSWTETSLGPHPYLFGYVAGPWMQYGTALLNPDHSLAAVVRCGEGVKAYHQGRRLGTTVWDEIPSICVSPDGTKVAYPARLGKQCRALVGGQPGSPYDDVDAITWSPDSRRLAYRASTGEKACVVADGTPGPRHQFVRDITFSPDGARLAYTTVDADGERVVLDGVPGVVLRSVRNLTFSKDGRRIAYVAKTEDGEAVITDGVVGTRAEHSFGSIVFSPDGRRLVYVDRYDGDGPRARIFLDGQPGEWGPTVLGLPLFSPDSQHIAFERGTGRVSLDGKEEDLPNVYGAKDLIFSPDSQHLAYIAVGRDDRQWVVCDGKAGPHFDEVGLLQFAPHGNRLAYAVCDSSPARAGRHRVILDGEEQPQHDRVQWISFSPDGTRVAYSAIDGGVWRLFLDGKPVAEEIGRFRGWETPEYYFGAIVPDKPELAEHDFTGWFAFSPDSTHLAYTALSGSDLSLYFDRPPCYTVVVDGVRSPECALMGVGTGGAVCIPTQPFWTTDGALEHVAIRGNDLVRLRWAPR